MTDALFAPMPITLEEQIAAVEREIGMRHKVYPRRVTEKKMTQAKADHEIAAMRAVLTTLKNLKENPNNASPGAR